MNTDETQTPPASAKLAWPETAIGLGTLGLAGLVVAQTLAIPRSPLYSKVGPTIFPYLTAAGLALFGALLLVSGIRGGWQPEDEKEIRPDWIAVAYVVAGLVANVVLIGPLGFTLSSTVLFTLIARGFGSRRPLRDAGLGFAISLATYFGFAKALGVNIGAGWFENLIGAGE